MLVSFVMHIPFLPANTQEARHTMKVAGKHGLSEKIKQSEENCHRFAQATVCQQLDHTLPFV